MKIAYVLGQYPSLSETFIAREIEALRRRGFEIDIWALKAGEGARPIPELSVTQCLVKPLRKFSTSARTKYFHHLGMHWATQEKNALDEVQHIHAGWSSFPADIARGAAGVLGVPWSFSGHARDLWVENEGLAVKLQAAKFAACCTREGAEYLRSLASETVGRVLHAPHGIEISQYCFRERREKHDPIRVLAIGRLVEKKGFPVLLLAVAQLLEQEYSVLLTIIGEGPQRKQLEKQIARIHDSQLQLAGVYSHQQIIAAMQESDLFVMPSTPARDGDRDGLPNVLLEAAACGLPVVSTRAGGIEDFLDESCAWLCEPGDANALAETIQNAIENYDESLRRARLARSRVEKDFDVDRNIEILANAFAPDAKATGCPNKI